MQYAIQCEIIQQSHGLWDEIVSQTVCASPNTAVPSARRQQHERTVVWGTGVHDNSLGTVWYKYPGGRGAHFQ